MSTLVELSLEKVLQTRTYTVVVLKGNGKMFSIYMEPHIGQLLQSFFSHEKPIRPQTFEFLDQSLVGLDLKVVRVCLVDLQDAIYFSKILYFQEKHKGYDQLVEVDARPSDSLLLALRHKAPIYCEEHVLEAAIDYVDES